ncbi:MAG: protein kinase [Planctomycetes bacterium]|nr:protein kinase [Planctomycetota bacterium]
MPSRVGDYRILQRIGAGGMGVVYAAHQESIGRRVALKLLVDASADVQARFHREARIIGNLRHPSIAEVYEFGVIDTMSFLSMELVDGLDLARILSDTANTTRDFAASDARSQTRPNGTGQDDLILARVLGIEPDLAPETFRQSWTEFCVEAAVRVGRALQHAHVANVVHRDVKPSNIMVDRRGRFVLVDFGLARTDDGLALSRTGLQVGSLAYMAPEQLDCKRDLIGPATDVRGLGVTLFELLTRRRAYCGDLPGEVVAEIRLGSVPRIRDVDPTLPSRLDEIVFRAMQSDVACRYPSAGSMADDLEQWAGADTRTKAFTQPAVVQNSRRPAKRVSVFAVLCAALLPLALAGYSGDATTHRATSSEAARAVACLELGLQQLEDGQDHEGLTSLQRGVDLGSDECRSELARYHCERFDYAAALSAWGHLPEQRHDRELYAKALLRSGGNTAALAVYRQLLADDDPSVESLARAAEAAAQCGELSQSQAWFDAVLAQGSVDELSYNALYSLCRAIRQYDVKPDEEIAFVRSCVQAYPEIPCLVGQLSTSLLALGRVEDAIDAARRATALAPDVAPWHILLGRALTTAERFDEALSVFALAAALEPNRDVSADEISAALVCAGRFTEAKRVLLHAVARGSHHYLLYERLGLILSREDPAASIQHYRKALYYRPDSHTSRCRLALALSLQGDVCEAESLFESLVFSEEQISLDGSSRTTHAVRAIAAAELAVMYTSRLAHGIADSARQWTTGALRILSRHDVRETR